jgi:hypothetical protein
MLLTQSIGAIMTYIAVWAFYCFKSKEKRRMYFACDFFVSIVSAAFAYLFVSDGRMPAAALIFPVLAVVLKHKTDPLVEIAARSKGAPIAAAGAAGLGVAGLLAARGLRPLATYLERVIQISDALTLMLRRPLGIGAGEWQLHFTEYQTAPYTASLIHGGYAQLGADAGVPALLAGLGAVAVWMIYHKRGVEGCAAGMILCHAIFDISFSFLAVDLLLCMLAVSTLPEDSVRDLKSGRVRAAVRCALLIPLVLCGVLAFGASVKNRALWLAEAGRYGEASRTLEGVLFINDEEARLLRMEWACESGAFESAVRIFDGIDPPNARAYYLKGIGLLGAGEGRLAAQAAMGCVSRAPFQEYGYGLLEQTSVLLDPESRLRYLNEAAAIRAAATPHPMYKEL